MKYLAVIIRKGRICAALFLIAAVSVTCSKNEEKLELFSAEAFAYSIDSGWELNASCRARGFMQPEIDGKFTAKLSYTVELLTPEGNKFEVADDGLVDETSAEKIPDIEINTQIELDSSYSKGKYKIIFHVTDDRTRNRASIEKEFELAD
jgi:hypothetical protein